MDEFFTLTYINKTSAIHKTEAKYKIICFAIAIIFSVLCSNIFFYCFNLLLLTVVYTVAKIGVSCFFKPLKSIYLLFLMIVFMNMFLLDGDDILFKIGNIRATTQGLIQGLKISLNVFFVVEWSNLFISTTSPIKIMEGVKFYLKPLKFIGVNIDTLTLIISVSIQFIPILVEETGIIKKAQTARGVDFKTRNPFKWVKNAISLIIPVFMAAFKRADELSQALEARGYEK